MAKKDISKTIFDTYQFLYIPGPTMQEEGNLASNIKIWWHSKIGPKDKEWSKIGFYFFYSMGYIYSSR